jgi:hypothetical protein
MADENAVTLISIKEDCRNISSIHSTKEISSSLTTNSPPLLVASIHLNAAFAGDLGESKILHNAWGVTFQFCRR